MTNTNEDANAGGAKADSPALQPEYEWGVQFHSARTGYVEIAWGYSEDPRLDGSIDEDGEIEIRNYYHKVVAVGQRLRNPEIWTDF